MLYRFWSIFQTCYFILFLLELFEISILSLILATIHGKPNPCKHITFYLINSSQQSTEIFFLPSFYTWGNWGTGDLNSFPKYTQLVGGGDADLACALIMNSWSVLLTLYLETLLCTHFTGGETETPVVEPLTKLSVQDSVRFLQPQSPSSVHSFSTLYENVYLFLPDEFEGDSVVASDVTWTPGAQLGQGFRSRPI